MNQKMIYLFLTMTKEQRKKALKEILNNDIRHK